MAPQLSLKCRVDPGAKLERFKTESGWSYGLLADTTQVKQSPRNGLVAAPLVTEADLWGPSRFLCGGGTAADLRCDTIRYRELSHLDRIRTWPEQRDDATLGIN